ncbi:hypothetical protein J4Q44_G00223770 [Coregonus suidteri]|uniref:Uncharacterized protein n=1 Tax=Coregonus suidteri TaxID=861788 RepID=A0AAN8LDJ5_9TELE
MDDNLKHQRQWSCKECCKVGSTGSTGCRATISGGASTRQEILFFYIDGRARRQGGWAEETSGSAKSGRRPAMVEDVEDRRLRPQTPPGLG